ncbi:hypothetical protein LLY42_25275 [Pseudomonas frederiksbergensis]|nr:hypothetical protein LLY42_25275 [Pseudomonas frederiksbergensis]
MFDKENFKSVLIKAAEEASTNDLVGIVNKVIFKVNNKKTDVKCPKCQSTMIEIPAERFSTRQFKCSKCRSPYLLYHGRCRTMNKTKLGKGGLGVVNIRCYDQSEQERLISIVGWSRIVNILEAKSKDEFSILVPLRESRKAPDLGVVVFNNITLRRSQVIDNVRVDELRMFFPKVLDDQAL